MSFMRLFVGLRHAGYDLQKGSLTDAGKKDLLALMPYLREKLTGLNTRVLSSPAVRTIETAEIVCRELSIKQFEVHSDLFVDQLRPKVDLLSFLASVASDNHLHDALICVTHLELIDELPWCFCTFEKRKQSLRYDWFCLCLKKGEIDSGRY